MIQNLLGRVWRRLPKSLRRSVIRSVEAQFTVTAGAVVLDTDGRVLLLEHVFRPGSGWGIPGGFVQHGEQPEETLTRELDEEIGLAVDDVRIAFVRTLRRVDQVEIFFTCRALGEPRPRNIEIKRFRWSDANDLPQGLSKD